MYTLLYFFLIFRVDVKLKILSNILLRNLAIHSKDTPDQGKNRPRQSYKSYVYIALIFILETIQTSIDFFCLLRRNCIYTQKTV